MWKYGDTLRPIIPVVLTGLCTTALAQPCPVQYNCEGAGPEGGWSLGTSPGRGHQFVPDHRPVYWFNLYCGDDCRACSPVPNPKGQAPYWAEADWAPLEVQLDELFDAGFRRIVLQRPAGSLPGEWKLNQSQYHHLTDEQKSVVQNELAQWIACRRAGCDGRPPAPDLQMAVFIGSFQYQVCSPCLTPEGGIDDKETEDPGDDVVWWECPPDAEMRFMHADDPESLAEIYANAAPWAEAGFDAIWFDNASRNDPNLDQSPNELLALREMDLFTPLMLGGEAVPWYKVNGERYIDTYYTERAPWFAVYWWYQRTGWLGPKASNPHTTDPATTELGVVFGEEPMRGDGFENSEMVHSVSQIADVRDRGFVVWASHTSVIPYTQRLYDGNDDAFYAALILDGDPADFNADGRVDCADLDTFMDNWRSSLNNPPLDPAFWDGDIDNDDQITPTDLLEFITIRNWNSCLP